MNDELFVRNATTEEIRKAFAAPAPTPSSSPVPTLSAPQQEMLSSFSQKSGMNLEWSQKSVKQPFSLLNLSDALSDLHFGQTHYCKVGYCSI